MKKYIIVFALCVCAVTAGCSSNDEFVELKDVYSEGTVADLEVETVADDTVKQSADSDNSAEDPGDSLPIVVYICGEVNNPGVYELESGSRVFDAINTAGGYSEAACVDEVNLAQVILDEQMIYIPSVEDTMSESWDGNSVISSGTQSAGTASSSSGKININKASVEELTTIPGIGESKANKIISYRTENGKFNSIEDIMNISGIKEGLFNKVKDYICVK